MKENSVKCVEEPLPKIHPIIKIGEAIKDVGERTRISNPIAHPMDPTKVTKFNYVCLEFMTKPRKQSLKNASMIMRSKFKSFD
jgi:hypothetical protein